MSTRRGLDYDQIPEPRGRRRNAKIGGVGWGWVCCWGIILILALLGLAAFIIALINGARINDEEAARIAKDMILMDNVSALDAKDMILMDQIAELQAKDMILMQNITDLDAKDMILMQDISDLQAKDMTLMSDIADLQAKDMTLMSDISALQAKDMTLMSDISDLQAKDMTLMSDISDLQAKDMILMAQLQNKTAAYNREGIGIILLTMTSTPINWVERQAASFIEQISPTEFKILEDGVYVFQSHVNLIINGDDADLQEVLSAESILCWSNPNATVENGNTLDGKNYFGNKALSSFLSQTLIRYMPADNIVTLFLTLQEPNSYNINTLADPGTNTIGFAVLTDTPATAAGFTITKIS